jgi:hypothetical protein
MASLFTFSLRAILFSLRWSKIEDEAELQEARGSQLTTGNRQLISDF